MSTRCKTAALALGVALLLLALSAAQPAEAILNLTLNLADPGTFSTTFSPRRIVLELNLTFGPKSNVIGPANAWIPVTAYSTICKFTRFTWSQTGVYYPATRTYQVQFRNPILTWNGAEFDAFKAMERMYIEMGASSHAVITQSRVCVFFERLGLVELDNVLRTFQLAYTRCQSKGGFMATLLKPYDETWLNTQFVSSTGDYWIGGWTPDNRPAVCDYCWRGDPDYDQSGCVMGGFYAYMRVTAAMAFTCMRPVGFTCNTPALDFDSLAAPPPARYFNMRFHYVAPQWFSWDRCMNCSNNLGHVCTNLVSYGNICHSPTVSLVKITRSYSGTFGESQTPSLSLTNSSSMPTNSLSAQRTRSFSPSAGKSQTKSESPSVSDTRTPIRSATGFSATDSKTASAVRTSTATGSARRSLTFTATETITRPPTPTPTEDDTATASRTLPPTKSKTTSETISARASRTVTDSSTQSDSVTDTSSQSGTPLRKSATPSPSETRSSTAQRSRSSSTSDTRSPSPLARSSTRTPTDSESATAGLTETRTLTRMRTRSGTIQRTSSRSLSAQLSRTIMTPSKSKTPGPTRSRSVAISESVSDSVMRSRSISQSRSKSRRLRIRTPTPPKPRTKSKSIGTRTGSETPHSWESCSGGWTAFGDECYYHFPTLAHRSNETQPTPVTLADAVTFCEERGATIPVVSNYGHLKFLIELVGEKSGRKFWNGIYQDRRFSKLTQVWRTIFDRAFFDTYFFWDKKRLMPRYEDCVVVHNQGDLSKRIVGGNGAMITYPCDSRAEVVCVRRRKPWSVTAVNLTTRGALLHVEGRPLTLIVLGRSLPRGMSVQLQTTTSRTHSGPEGQPTNCTPPSLRSMIGFNTSVPGTAFNVSSSHSFHVLCNASCDSAVIHFPSTLKLVRGYKYSLCFFMPYNAGAPKSPTEFRWNFLPELWLEVAETRMNYLRETCQRHQDLVNLLYFDKTATDLKRVVPSPMYFAGPVQEDGFEFKSAALP